MSVDVVTKFYYLEHGKKAPQNSGYKGIIKKVSIIGWKTYTEREEAKQLHDRAKEENKKHQQHGFFGYTSERIGSKKTYTSQGWIETKEDNDDFRDLIAYSFHEDGDLIWTPIISLKDYMTAAEMKMFNEKDFAAVFDKILPKFFKAAGFKNDNMEWWMNYHVNTDNPHVHLSFFEKEKLTVEGFIPNVNIEKFKKMFWNEVFAQKRFLEQVGKEATVTFKENDILKQSAFKEFQKMLHTCNEKEFIEKLESFAQKLPETGRLQYGSSHMIPYRSELDQLVNYLLHTPEVSERYHAFIDGVKIFDEVRSKSLNLKNDTSFVQTEDGKLRTRMANSILNEIKNCERNFSDRYAAISKDDKKETSLGRDQSQYGDGYKIIPLAKSLIVNDRDDQVDIRIPGFSTTFRLNKERLMDIYGSEKIYLLRVSKGDTFSLYEGSREVAAIKKFSGVSKLIDNLSYENVSDYFSSSDQYLKVYQDHLKFADEWQQGKETWLQQRNAWIQNKYDWNPSVKRVRHASFAWMNEIESEVAKGQLEYLHGKELDI